MNFKLMQEGYVPINVKFADRKKYYDSFREYNENNGADAIISIFSEYVLEELEKYFFILN